MGRIETDPVPTRPDSFEAHRFPCYTVGHPRAICTANHTMKAILFVDDHKALARLSCEILQKQGYRAECAYDGREALAKFQQDAFDLVVTDYRMEGMSGVELARRLRRLVRDLPIVIVTGCADVEPCPEVDAWVGKQEMFPKLFDTIRDLLRERSERESAS